MAASCPSFIDTSLFLLLFFSIVLRIIHFYLLLYESSMSDASISLETIPIVILHPYGFKSRVFSSFLFLWFCSTMFLPLFRQFSFKKFISYFLLFLFLLILRFTWQQKTIQLLQLEIAWNFKAWIYSSSFARSVCLTGVCIFSPFFWFIEFWIIRYVHCKSVDIS